MSTLHETTTQPSEQLLGTAYSFMNMPDGTTLTYTRHEGYDETTVGDYTALIEGYKQLHATPAVEVPPEPVVRSDNTTLFTSSGIQTLNGAFFRGEPYPTAPIFINQPVIRTQFMDYVSPDTLTSFVNPGAIYVGASAAEHQQAFIKYLDTIRAFAPPEAVVTTIFQRSVSEWSGLEIPQHVARVAVDNLEIGDAIFMPAFPTANGVPVSISEFGLGKERLMHTIAGQDCLEASFGCQVDDTNVAVLDTIRTMTLMAASGVIPGTKNQSYQLRRFSKKLTVLPEVAPDALDNLITRSYDYWSQYDDLMVDRAATVRVVRQAYEYSQSNRILQRLAESGEVPRVDTSRGVSRMLASLAVHGLDNVRIGGALVPSGWSLRERPPKRTLLIHNDVHRDLLHAAKIAAEQERMRVVIMGSHQPAESESMAFYFPNQLSSPEEVKRFLAQFGRADYALVGKNYFSESGRVRPFSEYADNLIGYEDGTDLIGMQECNGRDKFLFCASDALLKQVRRGRPIRVQSARNDSMALITEILATVDARSSVSEKI